MRVPGTIGRWTKLARKFVQARNVSVTLCSNEIEMDAIRKLRYLVLHEELARYNDVSAPEIRNAWDPKGFHLQASVDGKLVGCVSLCGLSDRGVEEMDAAWTSDFKFSDVDEPEKVAITEQLVVDREYRGGGVAIALCWKLYECSLERGLNVGFMRTIESQVSYYTPFGWYIVGSCDFGFGSAYVLRHDHHDFGPMLRRFSPLSLKLLEWRLRGSPIKRPVVDPVRH